MAIRGRRFVRHGAVGAAVALAAVASLGAIAARAEPATEVNEVTNWNRVAVATLGAFPARAGGAPPTSQINMALVQGAVYDAVNAIEQTHEPYLLATTYPGASKAAAAAKAAHVVLTHIVSTVPDNIPFPNESSLQAALDAALESSVSKIPDSQAKTDGLAAGVAAAQAMISARQGDGRFGPSQWEPNSGVGHWSPLLAPDGTQILDPTPWAGGVAPFLMTSSSQFRTDGPPSLTSDAYTKDFNEVKTLGRFDSTIRTAEQTHIAVFWQSNPMATWNEVARNLADDPTYDVDASESARLLAMANLTAADAAINCWNDKYHWDFWRPWNAIARAGEDGNPATEADPTWRARITAPYPDHPSGHLCLDGAYLNVLQMFFGTDKVRFGVTSVQFPGEVRHFDRFSEPLKEIIDARIWAGLHFRTADVQAQILGRKVAQHMAKNYFQPLD